MKHEQKTYFICAFYNLTDNTINMIIGMMGEPFYSSDMSTEELYESIGAFWVGHEISHAFDSKGSQFDGIIAFKDKHFIGPNIDCVR